MTKNKINIGFYVPLVFVFLFLTTVILLNFFSLGRYMDSDMYGDMYVAKLMWEQKTLFPANWVFGNQIYILATPNIAALFYGLTGNMMISMSLASSIMIVLTLISFYYCFTACYSKKTVLFGIVVLFACFISTSIPDNEFGQLFFYGSTFYSCYIITLLVSLGVYLRTIKNDSFNGLITMLIVSSILSLLMGIQSLRQTLIMVLPIAFHQFLFVIYSKIKKKPINKSSLITTVLFLFSNLTGVIISKLIDVKREEIIGGLGFSPFYDIKNKILTIPYNILSLLGLRPILSKVKNGDTILVSDIFSIICSVALIIFIIVFIIFVIKNRKNENKNIVAANGIVVLLLGVLGTEATFFLIDISRLSKYLFVFFILVPAMAMYLFEKLDGKIKVLYCALVYLVSFTVLLISYISPLISTFTKKTDYDKIAEYMKENNKTIVYAVWNDAGHIAGASGGTILAGRWDATKIFNIKSHTNILDIYTEDDNAVACYMFTDDSLKQAKEYLQDDFNKLHLVKEIKHDDNTSKYLYISDRKLMYK